MGATSTQQRSQLKDVEITCHAPDAKEVLVAGTFNEWNPAAKKMKRDADGVWRVGLRLPPGRHEFKFIIDGVWCCEPGCGDKLTFKCGECSKCVHNSYGSMNRVLEVP